MKNFGSMYMFPDHLSFYFFYFSPYVWKKRILKATLLLHLEMLPNDKYKKFSISSNLTKAWVSIEGRWLLSENTPLHPLPPSQLIMIVRNGPRCAKYNPNLCGCSAQTKYAKGWMFGTAVMIYRLTVICKSFLENV